MQSILKMYISGINYDNDDIDYDKMFQNELTLSIPLLIFNPRIWEFSIVCTAFQDTLYLGTSTHADSPFFLHYHDLSGSANF